MVFTLATGPARPAARRGAAAAPGGRTDRHYRGRVRDLRGLPGAIAGFPRQPSQSSNIIFFLLINLNLILLVLLVFLVARNLAKLIFERRHRILGARLRTRLV